MIAETIREKLEQVPFERFQIRATSGKKYLVANPDLVVMMKSSVFVAAPNSDRAATIPYLHVAAVEVVGNGNGRPGPRRKK